MRKAIYIGCLLMLIAQVSFAELVTYTFTNYQTLTVSGDEPIGAQATIYNDTQSGIRIGAGHTATFMLTGYDGATVNAIYMAMRSNKSAGAGSMQLSLGNEQIASIPDASFASDVWYGAYVNDSIVFISVPLTSAFTVPENTYIELTISASVNSLYFAGCMIDYTISEPEPKTVTFVTSTEQTIRPVIEYAAGEGVILPFADDADSVWHFLGWAEQHYARTTSRPLFYEPGTRFYPTADCQLYALYTDKQAPEMIAQDTTFQSGVYALVSAPQQCMLMGEVELQVMGASRCNVRERADSLYVLSMTTLPNTACYYVDFTDAGATIQYTESGKYIGYNTTTTTHYLRSTFSPDYWNVFHGAHGTVLFYHDMAADSMAYCLYASLSQGEYWFRDSRLKLNPESQYLVLFPAPSDEPVEVLYTTHPFSENALHSLPAEDIRVTASQIVNPNGLTVNLFSLDGKCILTSQENISLDALSSGIYILHTPNRALKLFVR